MVKDFFISFFNFTLKNWLLQANFYLIFLTPFLNTPKQKFTNKFHYPGSRAKLTTGHSGASKGEGASNKKLPRATGLFVYKKRG